jgi:hypothetical protein
MKHKVGETVRIQSLEWAEKQNKDGDGDMTGPDEAKHWFFTDMMAYCGKTAKVTLVFEDSYYKLDIDKGENMWEDWMLDPDYRPDEPLSPEDAIRAMLDGERLYSEDGTRYWFKDDCFHWESEDGCVGEQVKQVKQLAGLRRRPEKRKRPWTRWEVLVWVSSEKSHSWIVKRNGDGEWRPPQYYSYGADIEDYRRARLLPDLSGVDPDTIQGFEVEE